MTAEWLAVVIVGAVLAVFAAERAARLRQQRDTYRRLLVDAVTDCAQQHEGRADRFEHLPGDVLAEALDTPTETTDV